MEEINRLREELAENDFELRKLEESLTNKINLLHSSVDQYVKLGILNEDQVKIIKALNINSIKTSNFEEFEKMFKELTQVEDIIQENISSLEKSIADLDTLYTRRG